MVARCVREEPQGPLPDQALRALWVSCRILLFPAFPFLLPALPLVSLPLVLAVPGAVLLSALPLVSLVLLFTISLAVDPGPVPWVPLVAFLLPALSF